MTVPTTCHTRGTQPPADARFCPWCGSPVSIAAGPAEYKQETVLFSRYAAVVPRYGETVGQFTGHIAQAEALM